MMNRLRNMLLGVAMTAAMASPALAVDTTQTYSSGILVILFVGFCALIVMFQLMPTIVLLFGFFKGLFKSSARQKTHQGNRA
ncbi:MAG: hypothetical protein RQ723_02355 [Desulfuromonadales bacterium]|nr:hypothetical protein [Desulfuromonadales bacterium]